MSKKRSRSVSEIEKLGRWYWEDKKLKSVSLEEDENENKKFIQHQTDPFNLDAGEAESWPDDVKLMMKFGLFPEEIPMNLVQESQIKFPVIAIDITKLAKHKNTQIGMCCLLCSLENKKNIMKKECVNSEKHYPYIKLIAKTDNVTETEAKTRKKKEFIFMLPIIKTEDNKYCFQKMHTYYWFFLTCILSKIKHPNTLTLFLQQDEELFPYNPIEKRLFLTQMSQILLNESTSNSKRKAVYLQKTFPSLSYIKTELNATQQQLQS